MNPVFFILACFVVVPVCLLLVFLGQLTFLAHPDIATGEGCITGWGGPGQSWKATNRAPVCASMPATTPVRAGVASWIDMDTCLYGAKPDKLSARLNGVGGSSFQSLV